MLSSVPDLLTAVQSIEREIQRLGLGRKKNVGEDGSRIVSPCILYNEVVTDPELRAATEKLFRDRHYARAVEEGFKCLNNYVKGRIKSDVDGAALMRFAFSAKKPHLKLNKLSSQSQRDEQTGYMDIFAGSMTGVRNPRVHEHRMKDDSREALELLNLANHLFRKARKAVRPRNRKN